MKKRVATIATASAVLLSACDVPTAPESGPATGGAVVYSAMQLAGSSDNPDLSTAGACRVVFPVTYPADVTPHRRQIDIRMVDSTVPGAFDSSGPVSFPFPADHPKAQRNPDGTVTWRGGGTTFSPCRPTSWEVVIGKCVSGDCPPARFRPSDQMGQISVRQVAR